MLLGSEFQLLSLIANKYTLHDDGMFRFTEQDLIRRFPDEELNRNLALLIMRGFACKETNQITIDIHKWAIFFTSNLEKVLNINGFNFKCTYLDGTQEIHLSEQGENQQVTFSIGLIPNFNQTKVIYLCYLDTFEFHLFWLDLLNDVNLLKMFVSFIRNEVSNLNNISRQNFSFSLFEGIAQEHVSQIFNYSIVKYFEKGGYCINKELSEKQLLNIKKIILREEFHAYEALKGQDSIIIVRTNNKIEFLSFIEGVLSYSVDIKNEINILREHIIEKLRNYNQLTMINNHKTVDNVKNAIAIVTVLLTGINGVILYAISKGIILLTSVINNNWLILAVAITQIIVTIATVILVIKPIIKLTLFNWNLNYKQ